MLPFQWLVMVAGDRAHGFEPKSFHGCDPTEELVRDVPGQPAQCAEHGAVQVDGRNHFLVPPEGVRRKAARGRAPSRVGQSERATQNRVIALFRDELGYRYLGDWSERAGNSNIEDALLGAHLTKAGYDAEQISRALYLLHVEADHPSCRLYDNNQAVYSRLRYGVPVKIEAGKVTETVKLIDWDDPAANDFAIAEEVTLQGHRERRPDLVLTSTASPSG